MQIFEWTIALLVVALALSAVARRVGVPYPTFLALGGVGLAFLPFGPRFELEPQLALALFVAPVLLDAAYDASPRDLRANWVSVANLALVAVALTVVAVAVTAHWLVPSMPWPAAVALGAIVAPPDASAATAVLRQVKLPHRLMVILEGESLLNDASALLIYRVAVGAAAGGMTLWDAPLLAGALLGGVALGYGLARLYIVATAHVAAGPANVLLQFLGTFGAWLLADALDLSAVLTVIAYAVTLARLVSGRMTARQRRYSYAVWDVAVFVLNVLAFILIGLQLRGILERLDGNGAAYAAVAAAVLAATVLSRIVWVMAYNTAIRWRYRWFGPRKGRPLLMPTVQGGLLVSWCGMRGIVTLAAALALPEHFPERDLIVFTAFCVVLGTLVLQGMTLRPLLAHLMLPRDDSVEQEMQLARRETARAALDALGADRADEAGHLLAREYEARLKDGVATDATKLASLRRRTLAAERHRAASLLREGRIGEDAFHQIEEDLDWAEADVDSLVTAQVADC